jgi:hypothetical protein
MEMGDFTGGSLLNRYCLPVGNRRVYGRSRSGNIEGHIVLLSQHCDHISPDLVCRVAVGRNAIRPHYNHIKLLLLH